MHLILYSEEFCSTSFKLAPVRRKYNA